MLDCLDPVRVPDDLVDARPEGDPVEPVRRRDEGGELRSLHHRNRRGGRRNLHLPDQFRTDAEHREWKYFISNMFEWLDKCDVSRQTILYEAHV